jgi:hypothetical protein
MQICGNGPWHCSAVRQRSAACACAPASALTATMAANTADVLVKALSMIPPFWFPGITVATVASSRDGTLRVNE